MLRESEILSQIMDGIAFAPLDLVPIDSVDGAEADTNPRFEVTAAGQIYQFAAEIETRNSPRAFAAALNRIQQSIGSKSRFPLLIVPYLREGQLRQLEEAQLSGVDLCGNGVICIPGKLLVYRTGKPNQFPDSAPTKYAYRGTTSLVARAFLCRKDYETLADIEQEIQRRGGSIAVSTISKALKRLESDLIVDRNGGRIQLLQADKLLENLRASYQPPKITRTLSASLIKPLEAVFEATRNTCDAILIGRSSVNAYAVMGRDELPVFYTTNIARLVDASDGGLRSTERFADLTILQTDEPTVYFDRRIRQALPYASPVQTYLELSSGDKREQEAAEQVKQTILDELTS